MAASYLRRAACCPQRAAGYLLSEGVRLHLEGGIMPSQGGIPPSDGGMMFPKGGILHSKGGTPSPEGGNTFRGWHHTFGRRRVVRRGQRAAGYLLSESCLQRAAFSLLMVTRRFRRAAFDILRAA